MAVALSPERTILNGRLASPTSLAQAMHALADPAVLTARGGFLLKATLQEQTSWLGIVPCILNARRSFHYDMQLQVETDYTLVGSVDSNGIFTLLFHPKQVPLAAAARSAYWQAYIRFARLVLANGYAGEGTLDWSTQQLLTEAQILSPAPNNLAELQQLGSGNHAIN